MSNPCLESIIRGETAWGENLLCWSIHYLLEEYHRGLPRAELIAKLVKGTGYPPETVGYHLDEWVSRKDAEYWLRFPEDLEAADMVEELEAWMRENPQGEGEFPGWDMPTIMVRLVE